MSIVLDARTAIDHFPGIGRYVVNLAQALKSTAPELELTLLRGPAATAQRLALPDLPAVECAAPPFSMAQQWIVPKQLRDLNATLYHSPYYLMPFRPDVPTVLTAYDVIPLVYPQYYTWIQRSIFRLAHGLALRTARAVIAISQATKADLVHYFGVDAKKIAVTPLAVDPHFGPQSTSAIEAVRRKYHLPARYVLYCGSNKPHKNLPRLIAAMSKSAGPNQRSGIHLVVAGAWDTRYPEAQRLVNRLGLRERVHFIGPVSDADLPALYSGALVFAFVSEYEGFGLPPLEAMACGTPVVIGNTSSLPEVIGQAGARVDPARVDEIAQAIDQIVQDRELRATMRQHGLEHAARFTWERTARQTLDVYRSVASLD
jgi:glycosyltransferase involved in cell wall biosynthesis